MKTKYDSIPYDELTTKDLLLLQKLRNTCLTDKLVLLNNREEYNEK